MFPLIFCSYERKWSHPFVSYPLVLLLPNVLQKEIGIVIQTKKLNKSFTGMLKLFKMQKRLGIVGLSKIFHYFYFKDTDIFLFIG